MTKRMIGSVLAGLLAAAGCMTGRDHQRAVGLESEKSWTLGLVQKEIHPGMTQAAVASAIGSPNIVSRDAAGQETWIYDKVGSEVAYSSNGIEGGLILVSAHSESGALRQTQKTTTVVIKFNEKGEVASTAYHASAF